MSKKKYSELTEEQKIKARKSKLAYYHNHRERQLMLSNLRYKKMRLTILEHYGGSPPSCACCGETIYEFLTIDHINGGGIKHRAENNNQPATMYRNIIKDGFPKDLRILCMNCNHSLGHYKICPHQNENNRKT